MWIKLQSQDASDWIGVKFISGSSPVKVETFDGRTFEFEPTTAEGVRAFKETQYLVPVDGRLYPSKEGRYFKYD